MPLPLAIVIPVGPGDSSWRGLLPLVEGLGAETVLVFARGCMPEDAALPSDARAIEAVRGRATQLNAGARAASAPWLWFLHADSRFDRPAIEALRRFIERDTRAVGSFDLRFADDGPALTRLNALGARWRSRIAGMPFGDQAFVMRRDMFEHVGGFPDVASEDHAFVWAARARGVPLAQVGATVTTSARAYAERGWWRTTCRHLRLTLQQAFEYSRPGRWQ